METHPYPKSRTEPELDNEMSTVSAGERPRLLQQDNLSGTSWPFLGSFALHAALVALISSPVFQYPLLINSQAPAILWFSPIAPPDGGKPLPSSLLSGPRVAFAAPQEASTRESSLQPPAGTAAPVMAEYHETTRERLADVIKPEMTVAAPPPVKKITKVEKPQKPPPDTPHRPLAASTPVPVPMPAPTASPTPLPAPAPVPVPARNVAVPVAVLPELPRALPAMPPVVTAVQNKPASRQLKKEAEPHSPVKPVDTPVEKPMSVSLPLLKGDLKLVMAGTILPDTTVTYSDFAPSRRDRPLSRAESRRASKIIPMVADGRDNARELVIARANPGVYTITAMPANGPASVTLSLKLYEGTSRAVTRELGRHTIANRKILLKILMPEGIVWDDDAAFSGSMEDSDGVTKFNAETGLMWKEYSE